MDISSVNSDLIRGNVTTIILGCLKSQDRYGYEILKEIEDKSNSQYVLKQATLYNQLKRLEKQGLVSSYDGNPDETGGGKRRYYALTKEGHAYLEKEKSEYEYSRTILDKLVSDDEFDFRKDIPFDASELRPYSKRDSEDKPKVVYKDKIVERRVFLDRYGNEVSEEEIDNLRQKAELESEEARNALKELTQKEAQTQALLRKQQEEALYRQEMLRQSRDVESRQRQLLMQNEQTALQNEEKLRQTEQQLAQKEAETQAILRKHQEEALLQQEILRQIKETESRQRQQLIESEQTTLQNEEKLRQTEERLRKAEEDKELVKAMLRKMEEDKLREDEIRRSQEEEERKRLEEERILQEQEAERKRQEQAKPAQTLEEMFAKLDAESEYKRQQAKEEEKEKYVFENAEPQEHTYINGYTNQVERISRSQTSLKEIFKQLDEREAKIDKEKEDEARALAEYEAQKEREKQEQWAMANALHEQEVAAQQIQQQAIQQPAPQPIIQPIQQDATRNDYYPAELETQNKSYAPQENKGPFVTSAVINRQEGGFDYEKDDVNYRDFFVSLQEQNARVDDEEKPQQQSSFDYQDSDIKTRLYAKGYKIRPYDRGNTSEYYTFNFIQSNRINRDTFLIILAFFVAEIAIMWASLATRVSYVYFLPITLVGCALCLIPTIVYLTNPTKRIRANFNFKLSILNRTMLFIELTVVCILIGFFGLGANVNDMDLILKSIILPMVLLTNLPLSSLIYWLLYRTRKYHTA